MTRKVWKRRYAGFEQDLDGLIGVLCAEQGYCNPLSAADLLHDERTVVTADRFAEAVLAAEGLDLRISQTNFRAIRRMFTDRYGASASVSSYVPPPGASKS